MNRTNRRSGQILVVAVIGVLVLAGVAALTVDIGYMMAEHADMQATADAAALAAVDVLLAEKLQGSGEVDSRTAARTEAGEIVRANSSEVGWSATFGVRDSDGNFIDKDTTTSCWAVKVTVSRNSDAPAGRLSLFFAPVFGFGETDVTCTAVAQLSGQVVKVLENLAPFALHEDDMGKIGDTITFYDVNTLAPGCFGLVDFDGGSSSTKTLKEWISGGYDYEFGLDPSVGYVWIDAATGFRSALESTMLQHVGEERVVCVYDDLSGTGTGAEFRVVSFALVTILDCDLDDADGDGETYIQVRIESMNEVNDVVLGGGLSSSNIRQVQLAL